MSEKSEGPAEKNSTTIAASIGAGPMSPTVVGVDEVVGVDDGDAGDGLVLDEDEGGVDERLKRLRGWRGRRAKESGGGGG